jgi:predicted ATP-dependent serine protease
MTETEKILNGTSTAIAEITKKYAAPKLEFHNAWDMAMKAVDMPPLKKLFGNYIFENSHTILGAERGSGKSFLAMQLCMAITGEETSFLGEEINIHGNCLIIDFELGERKNAQRLLNLYIKKHEPENYELQMCCPKKLLPDILDDLRDRIKELRPVLVVIDNLKTAFAGRDLQKGHEAIEVMIELNRLSQEYGFALLSIAHTKKNTASQLTSSDLISGSGSISDLADADFFIRKCRNPNERILKRDKSRLCEETGSAKLIRIGSDTEFKLIEDDVDESEFLPISDAAASRDEKEDKVKQLHTEGKSLREIQEITGIPRSTAQRFIKN